MKYKWNTTLAVTAISFTLGSSVLDAQEPANATNQPSTEEQTQASPAEASTIGAAPSETSVSVERMDEAGSLEQLAMTEPGNIEGKQIVNGEQQRIGKIEQVVRKTDDMAIYAVVSAEDESKSAVKVSDLNIRALTFNGSLRDLRQHVYLGSDYEQVGDETGLTDPSYSPPSAAVQNSPGERADATDPARQSAQSFLEQLAMSSPVKLEGTALTGADGAELGEIEHIVRNRAGSDMFAVISVLNAETRSVVRLAELELGDIGFDGGVDDLFTADFRDTDYQPLAGPE